MQQTIIFLVYFSYVHYIHRITNCQDKEDLKAIFDYVEQKYEKNKPGA